MGSNCLFHLKLGNSAKGPNNLGIKKKNTLSDFCGLGPLTTGPRSAVGNLSGYRCMSDGGSRGREFDLCPVPYFREIDQ